MKKDCHPTYKKIRYHKKPNCKKWSKNPNSKIHISVAKSIRERYQPYKITAPMLAGFFGLSIGHVRQIIKGVYFNDGIPIRIGQYRKLTQEQADEIRFLHSTGGWSYRQLERKYNFRRSGISCIIHDKTYRRVDRVA